MCNRVSALHIVSSRSAHFLFCRLLMRYLLWCEGKKISVKDTRLDCQQQADVRETPGRQSSHNTGPVWNRHISLLHKPALSHQHFLGRTSQLKVKRLIFEDLKRKPSSFMHRSCRSLQHLSLSPSLLSLPVNYCGLHKPNLLWVVYLTARAVT